MGEWGERRYEKTIEADEPVGAGEKRGNKVGEEERDLD